MNRLVPAFIFGAMLLFLGNPSIADESEVLKSHKVTCTVVSQDEERYVSAAIVDDKIWWVGQTYLVEDGKISYPVTVGGRVDIDPEDLATLVKVENSKVTVEYRGETYVFEAR